MDGNNSQIQHQGIDRHFLPKIHPTETIREEKEAKPTSVRWARFQFPGPSIRPSESPCHAAPISLALLSPLFLSCSLLSFFLSYIPRPTGFLLPRPNPHLPFQLALSMPPLVQRDAVHLSF